ncbi:hypothetical protein H8356DRAFT_999733 [Neocallimastix lanati (nom. inval.)]|jgi:hypothetical protein|nr:hypothetical protein H8356DRAFT_999733 [Neocallimastix sp. JGI-2020a]
MKYSQSIALFVTLFFLNVFGYKTDFNLEGAIKLKIDSCKTDADCKKDYQTRCLISEEDNKGYCISTLYCHEDNCVFESTEEKNDTKKEDPVIVNYEPVSYGYFHFNNGQTPTIILESCSKEEAALEKCYTRECSKNEQCFSGVCQNKVCISNKKSPLYICSNDKSVFKGVEEDDIFKTDSLTCKLDEEQVCKDDSDCGCGSCKNVDNTQICSLQKTKNLTFTFICGIMACAFIVFYISWKSCINIKHRKTQKDLKIKYEMEEAFLNHHNSRNYVELEDVDDYDINEEKKKFKYYNSFN